MQLLALTLPGGGESDSTDAILPDDRRLLALSYRAYFTELTIQSNISTDHYECTVLCQANSLQKHRYQAACRASGSTMSKELRLSVTFLATWSAVTQGRGSTPWYYERNQHYAVSQYSNNNICNAEKQTKSANYITEENVIHCSSAPQIYSQFSRINYYAECNV